MEIERLKKELECKILGGELEVSLQKDKLKNQANKIVLLRAALEETKVQAGNEIVRLKSELECKILEGELEVSLQDDKLKNQANEIMLLKAALDETKAQAGNELTELKQALTIAQNDGTSLRDENGRMRVAGRQLEQDKAALERDIAAWRADWHRQATHGQRLVDENAALKATIEALTSEGQQLQADYICLRSKMERLENESTALRLELNPVPRFTGRIDEAPIPWENLPVERLRPNIPAPEPTQAARVAGRAKAQPRRRQGDGMAESPETETASEGGQKPMAALSEHEFTERMKRISETAVRSHQKWNSSLMNQSDGAAQVASNFQDLLKNWEWVKPEMVESSRLQAAAERIVATEGRWVPGLMAPHSIGHRARVGMVKMGRDILAAIGEMNGGEEGRGKRARE